jgi:hypothetical protein
MSEVHAQKDPGKLCTFSVDEVIPADRPIWSEPFGEHVSKRFSRKLLFLPESEKEVANSLCDLILFSRPPTPEVRARAKREFVSRCHPLIDAVGTAFGQHRPLTLSPDSIWLVIQQGFAHHVAENAEVLRGRLVRHEGTRKLTENVYDWSQSSFELAISSFSSQIREHSDPFFHENLLCDFSTTTPAIRIASEVVLMDCYSSYFEYEMSCICGIPKITVAGSLSDWQRIRARVEMLEAFELGWWVGRLRPILDEFILTVEGRPNCEFWQAIYKPKKAYGQDTVTGWIADLFPYLNDAPARCRNHIFKYDREGWAIPVDHGVKSFGISEPGADRGVSGTSFPSGLASVPLCLRSANGSTKEVDIVAGFLAVEEDSTDLALSPVISWAIAERAPRTARR